MAVTLRVTGSVDGETAPEFERACDVWISPRDLNVILDLTGVPYISSAGLSGVLMAGKKVDRNGGRLLICGLASRLKQIFEMSGFDSLFSIFDTHEDALADCGRKTL